MSNTTPRKKRGPYTSISCAHCADKHLKCDGLRPCHHCIKNNACVQCIDRPRKKKPRKKKFIIHPPYQYTSNGTVVCVVPSLWDDFLKYLKFVDDNTHDIIRPKPIYK